MVYDYLVVTSINPRSRLEHQIACYRQWKRLGYGFLSFNSEEEASKLEEAGVAGTDIFRIAASSTAQGIHGIAAPRIKAVLHALVHKVKSDSLIIANSDIFPGIRKRMDALPKTFACAAFTRHEVFSIELSNSGSSKQYRGGLDIFFLRAASVQRLWALVENDDVAERMAFGIPGWDFYVGGLILSATMGGAILDGPFFFHASHRTTYQHIGEFAHYANKLKDMGFVTSLDYQQAADQFLLRIDSECRQNHGMSRLLGLIYSERPTRFATDGAGDRRFDLDAERLQRADIFHRASDAVFLIRQALTKGIDVVAFKEYFCASPAVEIRFRQCLECLYFLVYVKAKSSGWQLSSKYPRTNSHVQAIDSARRLSSKLEMRYQLVGIFLTELIDYGIFNKNLFRAIALSCINDRERWLFEKIATLISERNRDRTV